jgi:membrane protein
MPLGARSTENWATAPVLHRWWRFSRYVVARFQNDRGLQTASALTYTSLLSLVPLLAVSLVILSGFGAFDDMKWQVQELLLDFFVPNTADQIGGYIGQFLENAQKLTAPGVIALGITAILTLSTIEATFNRIWRAKAPRPWPTRILAFWAVLTLGPIVLGMSLSVSAEVEALTSRMSITASLLAQEGRQLVQFCLQCGAFTALYLVIPAVRVKLVHALAGGVAATIMFYALKWGFAEFVASADNYRTIYGALAAVPIFLLWLYSFWTLLLIGAHVAAALPERRLLNAAGLIDQTTAEWRLQMAVRVLRRLWRAAGNRETLDLGSLDPEPSPAVLEDLERSGLVVQAEGGRIIAGCDYARAPIGVLWRALDLATPQLDSADAPPVLAGLMDAERDFMARPLADLLAVQASGGSLDSGGEEGGSRAEK